MGQLTNHTRRIDMCKKCVEWQDKAILYLEEGNQLRKELLNLKAGIDSDMGIIVGKEVTEKASKEDPKPKRQRRIGTKTETKKFRKLLDNPKDLWKDLNGLEGGVQ